MARCVVAGGGSIGLAISRKFSQTYETLLLESCSTYGTQTSSRNSEVLHAGIYYQKDSLKAKLCVKSVEMMSKYLLDRKIPYNNCGKIIVATNEEELSTLNSLYEKAQRNGVYNIQKISKMDVKVLEPEVHCVAALWSPSTSIFDSHSFMTSLVCESEENGTNFVYNCEVLSVRCNPQSSHSHTPHQSNFLVKTNQGEIECDIFINACGHNATHIHYETQPELVNIINNRTPTSYYLKGNYFKYLGSGQLFHHLVYPLPHKTGALGVHATIDMTGHTKFGPDAVWIQPSNGHNLTPIDYQMNESHQPLFEAAIRKYFPSLQNNSITPDYTGIRPRLLGPHHTTGSTIDQFGRDLTDFVIDGPRHHHVNGLVNLYGIESPGLTCSLAVADYVYDLIQERA